MSDTVYEKGYPADALARLHDALEVVCPCRSAGPSIGRWDDKSTWRFLPNPDASEAQIAAALNVMSAFDPWGTEHVASAEPVAAGPDLGEPEEIGEPDASPDIEPDEMGDSVDADFVDSSGDWGVSETDPDAGPGDPDYSVSEPVGDVDSVADEPEAAPVSYPGMMIAGDALASAKALALMKVDDERYIRVGDYDKSANQTRLDAMRSIQQAIREGIHPPFTDEEAEELQALETFLPFIQRIDDHAQGLRNAIREVEDLDALAAIDLQSGWPE